MNEVLNFRGTSFPIQIEVVEVDCDYAQRLLNTSIGNRNQTKAHIDRLSESMIAGDYLELLDPVRVSDTGKLIDGHHRLTAVANTGQAQKLLIVRGFPESVFEYIDQGQARTVKDTFGLGKVSNPAQVGAAVKFFYQLLVSKTSSKIDRIKPSNPVAMHILKAHPAIAKSVMVGLTVTGPKGIHAPLSPVAVAHFLWTQQSRGNVQKANTFFQTLQFGPYNVENDPAVRLRNKLEANWAIVRKSTSSQRWDESTVLGWFFQAWEAYVNDRPLHQFYGESRLPKYNEKAMSLARTIDAKQTNGFHAYYGKDKESSWETQRTRAK